MWGGGTVSISNSTVAYNTAASKAGGIYINSNTLTMASSIISSNTAATDSDISPYNSPTINASYSLVSTGTALTNGVDGNIVGQEAGLFPLGNYGGPTQTHALKDLSPCIGKGSDPLTLSYDQRGQGFPRALGAVDMGAVEYHASTSLTVSATGTGSGVITSSPEGIDCGSDCTENYYPNTTVTLTAMPDTENTFSGWGGDCSGTGTCSVSMSEARSVTAEFTLNTYALNVTVSGTGTGTVSSDPAGIECGVDCSEEYGFNETVTLSAAASAGSIFSGWTGNCSGLGECNVTIDQARSVTAEFSLNQYTVRADSNGNGFGSVYSDPAGISYGYPAGSTGTATGLDYGSSITITATAESNSTVSWTGCSSTGGTSTSATCTFSSLDGNKTAAATFILKSYSVTANATGDGSGTISSDVGEISYTYPETRTASSSALNHGGSITLTAYADEDTNVSWSNCDTTGGTENEASCTISPVDGDKDVTATFKLSTYTLSVQLGGDGTGTVKSSQSGVECGTDCDEVYTSSTEVTLIATPGEGSEFRGWTGACSGTGEVCVITVDQDLSVGALFGKDFPWELFLPAIMNKSRIPDQLDGE